MCKAKKSCTFFCLKMKLCHEMSWKIAYLKNIKKLKKEELNGF